MVAGLVAMGVVCALAPPVAAAVPPPTATTAVVSVKVGADRVGEGTTDFSGLAGVRLGLFFDQAGNEPVGEDWSECVSDVDGDCNFVIPGGLPNPVYIRQLEVPAGWYGNPVLGTENGVKDYTFQTPPTVTVGNVYRSGVDFMQQENDADPEANSTGFWQQSRDNVPLRERCGLDVAIVTDLSGSIGPVLPEVKEAMRRFTDELVGTQSRMAVFSFATNSPASGGANFPELIPVSTQAGADAFKAQFADWTASGTTNWDQGIWRAASAQERYDLILVVTDGDPTTWDDLDGGVVTFDGLEAGIFSANAAKAAGTRVMAMGLQLPEEGGPPNLRAISGPTAYDGTNAAQADYFLADDVQEMGAAMNALARANCAGSVSVVKMIAPPDTTGEDVTGATPAGPGWTFDAEAVTTGATVTPPSATTVDDGTGAVSFAVEADGAADVRITEQPQQDFSLVTQGGQNAVCRDPAGETVPVTNSGETGFTVNVAEDGEVLCTVYNRPAGTKSILVDKDWNIGGVTYPDGQQPDGYDARLTLTGPGTLPASGQPFGVARAGYEVGDQVVIDEEVDVPSSCRVVSRRITGPATDAELPFTATVAEGANAFRIVNTVDCPPQPRLSLDKRADRTHVRAGQTVTYTITATNTGDADFTEQDPASFTDDLSRVLRAATYNGDATATSGTVTFTRPALSWSGPLASGASVTVRYSVTIERAKRAVKACNTATAADGDRARACVSIQPSGKGRPHHDDSWFPIPWPSPWDAPWKLPFHGTA
ncbi:hypothetical protein [Actinocorallia sp. A-T 12471]|uniref:DUF7927 domain-containing protein n=1 Tax=Actinocorallia sp. A-T 12471 TaxID=3089813 RepID=UPI0029CFDB1C|nr:hypothetical protein [Actinocorallia sp. A-T 12471]MDX6741178.1 hypothetical protein [Actinocorallia sp. A-T 12471]